jgi:hypothetical protein
MILAEDGNISIITQDKTTILELVKKTQSLYPKFKNKNIIVNLLAISTLKIQDILEFLELSNRHRASKHSFVIVSGKVNLDEVPDEIVVVPTIQEAYDIIEMEEMERDLNF